MWLLCFILSITVFISTIVVSWVLSKKEYTYKKIFAPINIIIFGVFVANILIFIPICAYNFSEDVAVIRCIKTVLISMHHSIRLFIVDCDFFEINDAVVCDAPVKELYILYMAILYVLSPILTFSFALSFIKDIEAYRRYITGYGKDVYFFSELNDRSLALASSIYKSPDGHHKKTLIAFTHVFETNDDKSYELVEGAREIGALMFRNDILSLKLGFHSKNKKLTFYAINDEETENIKQALSIIEKYRYRKNTKLYVFSHAVEGEVLLSAVVPGELRIRRINEHSAIIYSILGNVENKSDENYGVKLFEEALPAENNCDEKRISAVVLGAGRMGTEMIKALSWFCQMDKYSVDINVFDKDKGILSKFAAECPDLVNEKYNGNTDDGDAHYNIRFFGGIDAESSYFLEKIYELKNVSYVFISMGDDERNIHAALKLRSAFEKMGIHPRIQAVVRNSDRKQALNIITNFKGQPYDIDFVGDIKTNYAIGKIIDSELEKEALERHLKWGSEDDFWKYEYNYRSSVAAAIHKRIKIALGIQGADKPLENLSDDEKEALRRIEHRRWNAYMRSEGYTYAEKRNDLAKTHNCLVSFDQLHDDDKAKDDN